MAVFGGLQKEVQAGSKMPAPGTTMSTVGKVDAAAAQRALSCGQETTFVLWKTAEGAEDALPSPSSWGYCLKRASPSGLSWRSPMVTEQPFSRSSFAKARLMPTRVPGRVRCAGQDARSRCE